MKKAAHEEKRRQPKHSKDEMPPPASLQGLQLILIKTIASFSFGTRWVGICTELINFSEHALFSQI